MNTYFRDGTSMGSTTKINPDSCWKEIVGKRKLRIATFVEYGLAEEVIVIMEFKDDSFEVGIGESLRPYDQLYKGNDREEATKVFLEAIKEHTWYEEDDDEAPGAQ